MSFFLSPEMKPFGGNISLFLILIPKAYGFEQSRFSKIHQMHKIKKTGMNGKQVIKN